MWLHKTLVIPLFLVFPILRTLVGTEFCLLTLEEIGDISFEREMSWQGFLDGRLFSQVPMPSRLHFGKFQLFSFLAHVRYDILSHGASGSHTTNRALKLAMLDCLI